jgi:hypothetical protein
MRAGHAVFRPYSQVEGQSLSDDILSLTATELVALYRTKQLSPVEVVIATLERIERLNPIYNAFVFIDAQRALEDARASEQRWQRGAPDGLIDGVPATVKDLVVVKGWPTRRGSRTPRRAWKTARRSHGCTARAPCSWARPRRRSSAGKVSPTAHSPA